jgi:hypothetical protein
VREYFCGVTYWAPLKMLWAIEKLIGGWHLKSCPCWSWSITHNASSFIKSCSWISYWSNIFSSQLLCDLISGVLQAWILNVYRSCSCESLQSFKELVGSFESQVWRGGEVLNKRYRLELTIPEVGNETLGAHYLNNLELEAAMRNFSERCNHISRLYRFACLCSLCFKMS